MAEIFMWVGGIKWWCIKRFKQFGDINCGAFSISSIEEQVNIQREYYSEYIWIDIDPGHPSGSSELYTLWWTMFEHSLTINYIYVVKFSSLFFG